MSEFQIRLIFKAIDEATGTITSTLRHLDQVVGRCQELTGASNRAAKAQGQIGESASKAVQATQQAASAIQGSGSATGALEQRIQEATRAARQLQGATEDAGDQGARALKQAGDQAERVTGASNRAAKAQGLIGESALKAVQATQQAASAIQGSSSATGALEQRIQGATRAARQLHGAKEDAGDQGVRALKQAGDQAERITGASNRAAKAQGLIGESASKAAQATQHAASAIQGSSSATGAMEQRIQGATRAARQLQGATEDAGDQGARALKQAGDQTVRITGASSRAAKAQGLIGESASKAAQATQKVASAIHGSSSATEALEQKTQRATRAARQLQGATEDAGNKGARALKKAGDQTERIQHGLDKVGNKLAIGGAALGAGLGLHTAFANSMSAQHQQAALANIADLSPEAQKAMAGALRAEVQATNQSVISLTEGVGVLMGAGWDDQKALAAIRGIGKGATATQASVEDLSKTVLAGVDNLKVPVAQTSKYLDILASAGKQGNFELKDMARFLPSLGAMAGAKGILGLEGTSQVAAALQVARMGTGTSEEAGTNTMNFLMKLTAPDAVRNFAKVGVNLESEFTKGKASGDVLAHMGTLIQRVTKGNEFRMGELFGDMQVKLFLAPFLRNLDRYKEIQRTALGADGVVGRDFDRMLGTSTEKWKRFKNGIETKLMPRLDPWFDRINIWLDKIEKHPAILDGLITSVLLLTGGGLLAKGISGLAGLWGALSKIAAWGRAGGLATVLGPVKGALAGVAAAGWPVTAVVGAVALAALLIYRYWGPIKGFLADVNRGASEENSKLASSFEGVSRTAENTWGALRRLLDVMLPLPAATRDAQGAQDGLNQSWTLGCQIGWGLAQVFKAIYTVVIVVLGAVQMLVNLVATAWDGLSGVIGTIGDLFGSDRLKNIKARWGAVGDRNEDRWGGMTWWQDLHQVWNPQSAPSFGSTPWKPSAGTALPTAAEAPTLSQALTQGPPVSQGDRIHLEYKPSIQIGGASEQDKGWFLKELERHQHEVVRLLEKVQDRRTRHAGAY